MVLEAPFVWMAAEPENVQNGPATLKGEGLLETPVVRPKRKEVRMHHASLHVEGKASGRKRTCFVKGLYMDYC